MKRIIFAVIFAVASISTISTKAQINVSINIGQQPDWGPTGYNHVDYYYLPDVDAYYYVPSKQYVYLVNGTWVWRNSLPSKFSGYDLYNGYKVVMNTPKPYLSHQTHVSKYSKYKNNKGKQPLIRDSHDEKYSGARDNKTGQNNKSVSTQKPTQSKQVQNRTSLERSARDNNNKGKSNQKADNKSRSGNRK